MDFTWVIGTVCVTLSSPTRVISDGEVAVTIPAIVVPSRMSTDACGPEEAVLSLQDARSMSEQIAAHTKMICHLEVGLGVGVVKIA